MGDEEITRKCIEICEQDDQQRKAERRRHNRLSIASAVISAFAAIVSALASIDFGWPALIAEMVFLGYFFLWEHVNDGYFA